MNIIGPDSNPYQSPAATSATRGHLIKPKRVGIFKLPNNDASSILLARETSQNIAQAKESTKPFLLLDPRSNASRDHAEINFDPVNSKLFFQDRGSAYGSYVDIEGDNGTSKRIFIIDFSKLDPALDSTKDRKKEFLEGAQNAQEANFPVASIELDLSKPWKIYFGPAAGHENIRDVIINDGNQIRYQRQNFYSIKNKPEKDDLIFLHNTLKREHAEKGMLERTRLTCAAVIARLSFKKNKSD